jgi:mycofactocin system transcriptional regulator
VAHVALGLFATRGFEETTVEDIAAALGVGRRTVFRYFPSKNDMVWGDFDGVINRLRADLAAQDRCLPIMEAVARATVTSNRYPAETRDELRMRLSLITTVPALQAHSMLRYREWRAVVAEYVGQRRDEDPGELFPQTIAYAALATAISAFSHWVHRGGDLEAHLIHAFASLDSYPQV